MGNTPVSHGPDWPRRLGGILILLGVAVWGVYALQRWGLGREVRLDQYLPWHLVGVIPGFVLRRWRGIRRLFGG